MIEEISFKNILSFKNEVTLSFEALPDDDLENAHVKVMPNGTRLLRLGIIYGSNASGKLWDNRSRRGLLSPLSLTTKSVSSWKTSSFRQAV